MSSPKAWALAVIWRSAANGDIFVSTNTARDGAPTGIVALRLDRDHKAGGDANFGTVAGGTSIRFYKNALYAASPTTVYRFDFTGHELVPDGAGANCNRWASVKGISQSRHGV